MIRAKLVVRWVTTCEALVLNVLFASAVFASAVGISFFFFLLRHLYLHAYFFLLVKSE